MTHTVSQQQQQPFCEGVKKNHETFCPLFSRLADKNLNEKNGSATKLTLNAASLDATSNDNAHALSDFTSATSSSPTQEPDLHSIHPEVEYLITIYEKNQITEMNSANNPLPIGKST